MKKIFLLRNAETGEVLCCFLFSKDAEIHRESVSPTSTVIEERTLFYTLPPKKGFNL